MRTLLLIVIYLISWKTDLITSNLSIIVYKNMVALLSFVSVALITKPHYTPCIYTKNCIQIGSRGSCWWIFVIIRYNLRETIELNKYDKKDQELIWRKASTVQSFIWGVYNMMEMLGKKISKSDFFFFLGYLSKRDDGIDYPYKRILILYSSTISILLSKWCL